MLGDLVLAPLRDGHGTTHAILDAQLDEGVFAAVAEELDDLGQRHLAQAAVDARGLVVDVDRIHDGLNRRRRRHVPLTLFLETGSHA